MKRSGIGRHKKANKKANNSVSGRPTSSQRVSLPRMSVRCDLQICDRLGFPGTQRNDEVARTDQKVAGSNPAERANSRQRLPRSDRESEASAEVGIHR